MTTPPERDNTSTEHGTLKYSLLGPSLTKAGQDSVDQQKISEIIYEASRGSKFFEHEENRDKVLTVKIEKLLAKKAELERLDCARDLKKADECISELELSRDLTQTIVHVDCDAFFAAVEELDRPELKDLPFSVGKGVLSTCNYHARKFGCRSGMAEFVAKKLCPSLILLPLNFDKYTVKAQEVREILVQYDSRFESASIDEAYLNITNYCHDQHMSADEAVKKLRGEVEQRTKITVSAGIAANAKLAKICSDKNKPNGQFKLENDRSTIMAFMHSLPTRKVNGIGRVFERELNAVGVKTCGDLYEHRQYLSKLFGEKAFWFLMQCYLGLGRTEVQPAEESERKSVGTESTFSDMRDPAALREKLRSTAEALEADMDKAQRKGRTLVLKVKLHTYEVLTRQTSPPRAVHLADDLYKYSLNMLARLEQEFPGLTLRLMGLRCTNLISMRKPDTLDFFGLKRKPIAEGSSMDSRTAALDLKRKASMSVDSPTRECWPDQGFEEAARQEYQEELEELEHLSQLEENIASQELMAPSNTITTENAPPEEWWECPICLRPQSAHERDFNAHIDLCLSRQAIKEAVQDVSKESLNSPERDSKRARNTDRKGHGRLKEDRKQTVLRFS